MRRIEKTITVEVLDYAELSPIEKSLIKRACLVRLNAQAPYSNYWVGCSVVTAGGRYFDGCNIENVNYSETMHAEETAIGSAIIQLGTIRIGAMAVVGAKAFQEVSWPPGKKKGSSPTTSVSDVCPSCGHCLQIIAENCFDENGNFDPTTVLLNYNDETGEIFRTTIGDAYPMPFLPQHLGINYAQEMEFFRPGKQ